MLNVKLIMHFYLYLKIKHQNVDIISLIDPNHVDILDPSMAKLAMHYYLGL